MRLIRLALLVLMAALGSPSVWSAMDPKINVKVTATPASVTLQRTGLLTQAADLVTIQNDTTNYLNGVSITGTVSLIGSTDALTVSYVPVTPQQGGGCTFAATTSTTSSVNCPVGTLAPRTSTVFLIVVQAPFTGSRIDFAWSFAGSEGKSFNGCCSLTGTTSTTLVDPTTSDSFTKNVQSFVGHNGGMFFTGLTSEPNPSDPFTTHVTVPTLSDPLNNSVYTTAAVVESEAGIVNCSNFFTCYQSSITIPGTFSPYLTIVLREDAENIKPGTKIESVVISYIDENGTHDVGLCGSPTQPTGTGIPCIASRVAYKKDSSVPVELRGDFEWTLINTKNGSIRIQ